MQLSGSAKRLAIFAFYDADGIVDDYIPYLLQKVGEHCSEQIVVVNGTLTPAGEAALRGCCSALVMRPNEGFDITGYKETFLGLAAPEQYDEILFYNQTIFGPVTDLGPMFRKMADRDVDFWGLTRHKGAHAASWDTNTAIPPHLQSFFFAVRSSLFTTEDFVRYWNELPRIESYWDAVSKHEIRFTRHFEQLGYRWSSYIDSSDLEELNDYPLMGMPTELLQRGCPFLKRKSFLCSTLEYSNVPQGAATASAMEWLRANSDYPLGLITQNLLRTAHIADVTRAIAPYYLSRPAAATGCTAAVLWFTADATAPYLCRAAGQLTADDRLYCIFATRQLADRWLPRLPKPTEWLVSADNGLAVLFGRLWPRLADADWLLYLNDAAPGLLDEFADATTLDHASRLLTPACACALLNEHPEFGLVCAVPGVHQETLSAGYNWPEAAEALRPGLQAAGICVPQKAGLSGLAVRGSLFFARTAAVAPLHRFAFTDGMFEGLYPAAEHLVPLAAQAAGYLTAFVLDEASLRSSLSGHATLLNAVMKRWYDPAMPRSDQVLFRMDGILDFYKERCDQMTLQQAFTAKLTLKQKLWICLQLFLKPETFAKLRRK